MADVSNIAEANHWNITRIADALGFHRDTVRKRLREAGVAPAGKKGNSALYRLADAAQALYAEPAMALPEELTPDKMMPKDRKEWFQSENERLKFQERTRELIPEGEYREELAANLKQVVAFFDSLPDRMERRRLFTPEQLMALEAESDALRQFLYQQLIEVE